MTTHCSWCGALYQARRYHRTGTCSDKCKMARHRLVKKIHRLRLELAESENRLHLHAR